MQQPPVPPAALDAAGVRDTIDVVFRGRAFVERSLSEAFWDRVSELFLGLFTGTRDAGRGTGWPFWIALVAVAVAATIVLARIGVARERRRLTHAPSAGPGSDPWRDAERARADGRLVEAAHLLCAAVLASLARRELVRAHASKTLGDYARELRARRSDVAPAFRTFVARYERFVYAAGAAHPAAYEELRTMAESLARPSAPAAPLASRAA